MISLRDQERPASRHDLQRLYKLASAQLLSREAEIQPVLGPSVQTEGQDGVHSLPMGKLPGVILGEITTDSPTVVLQRGPTSGGEEEGVAISILRGQTAVNACESRVVINSKGRLVAGKSALPELARDKKTGKLTKRYTELITSAIRDAANATAS